MARLHRRPRFRVVRTVLGATLVACASGTEPAINPVPRVATVSVVEGDSLVLAVDGRGFLPTSRVVVNQQPTATRFVSAARLEARVNIGSATTFTGIVAVANPAPGGGVSAQVPVSWTAAPAPIPTLASISPAAAPVGTADVVLTFSGTGFMRRTVVYTTVGAGVVVLPVSVSSPTTARVTVPAALVANPARYPIYVLNQGPGGGTATGATFEVRAPVP